jgi:hypothetical protein
MPITRLVARTLVVMVALHVGLASAWAQQIRCSGPDCETLRIRCRGAGGCRIVIMTEGLRTGPYVVSVESAPGMLVERLEVERFTNVTIATGRGDDGVGFIDAHVPGTLRIDTGPGDDAVGWDDSGAVKLRIDTGGGDDTIVFDGGGLGRRSSITMGAGADLILASSGFAGPSTIDGGGGDDLATLSLIPFDDPPPPRIRRFETLTD